MDTRGQPNSSLDEETRQRIWERVKATVGDEAENASIGEAPYVAPALPTATATVSRRGSTFSRALLTAAAVIGVLAAGVLIGRTSSDNNDTGVWASGHSVEPPLRQLADSIAGAHLPVLGDAPENAFSWVEATTIHGYTGPIRPPASTRVTETWTALDGSGRVNDSQVGPGRLMLGSLSPVEVLALPDDGPAVIAAIEASQREPEVRANVFIEATIALTHAGIPATARAGLIRALATFDPTALPSQPGEIMIAATVGQTHFIVTLDAATGATIEFQQRSPAIGHARLTYVSGLRATTN